MTFTIQEAIQTILAGVGRDPIPDTVDTIKQGDPAQPLTGILITFLATAESIDQAKRLNANLVITHEPTFYTHRDKTDWLSENPVYQAKKQLIETKGVVVWRFHDYLHSLRPDPVEVGIVHELGWDAYWQPEHRFCQIPEMHLGDLVAEVKQKLNIPTLRYIGDPEQTCRNIVLIPGFPPAEYQIGALRHEGIDTLLCGEIHEWETNEFTRDANYLGKQKALVVLGHAYSEEPGMRAVIPWLQTRLPEVPIHFMLNGSPFRYA
jgi:putative NIF3 family GTP cyclohydrolase 1 type 2